MSRRAFSPGDSHRARGTSAEDLGVDWLARNGYEIVERNVSSRYGELDLVARHDDTLCFVEIKARATGSFGSPLEAVTPAKQRRITRCAEAYLQRSGWRGACRFDVLGMCWGRSESGGRDTDPSAVRAVDAEEAEWRFELVRDAFPARR
ncbi:MAG: YraN family protein [Thermoanaerobaculia bacterium]|nr:YraN family protein [Thermoanaerobaculia bacterium]